MKKIRIGSGAGYAGDRIEPAVELMEKGDLDYIIFECLAERTVALGQEDKIKDPETGYNRLLKRRMEKILPLAKGKGIKVITNMGGANPEAAAEVTLKIAERLGLTGLKIAYITGDDIVEGIEKYYGNKVLENGSTLYGIKEKIISANAYMGAEGIVEALGNGADIIITGRVSDPSLTIGPLIHEFNWNVNDNPEEMGQGILAGHILECAGQVTGGYFADPGFKEVPNLEKLGFPLIEIDETGKFTITKVEGTGGVVTVDTCKEQLVYEIHNPKEYLTPDGIADFSKVEFTQTSENTVKAEKANSWGKPDNLKVTIAYRDGFMSVGEISYGGSNCLKRAELAGGIVEKRLEIMGIKPEELRIDYIGYNSLYKRNISDLISEYLPSEVRLRICARVLDIETAHLIADEVETLYTNGPAGGGGAEKRVDEIISVCSIFVPREDVKSIVSYLEV